MNLVVVCTNYPYLKGNAEYNLLNIQLNSFKNSFKNIFLLPTGRSKSESEYPQHKDKIFFNLRKPKGTFLFKFLIHFFEHIGFLISEIKSINRIKRLKKFKKSLFAYVKGIYLMVFLEYSLKNKGIHLSEVFIYSFWFDDYTLGALLFKLKYPTSKVITGAHGHDLYFERHPEKSIPFRYIAMELIDHIIPDSKEGAQYLKYNFPLFKHKVSHLNSGVIQKYKKSKPSNDGIFRALTLSRTDSVKRIDYLLNTLKELEDYSDFEIQYFHIGNGEELDDLKEYTKQLNFNKFKIKFLGSLDDNDLKAFFEKKPIDVFLNVSSSEGTSMALIEALSYAIPTIVTNVGGNKTIGKYCKTLLPLNFKPNDLFEYFKKIHFDNTYRDKLRKLSYSYWLKNHDVKVTERVIKKVFKETARSS